MHSGFFIGEKFIPIVGTGFVRDDKAKGVCCQLIFRDDQSEASTEIVVCKWENPMLWADIEKLENGGSIPHLLGIYFWVQ